MPILAMALWQAAGRAGLNVTAPLFSTPSGIVLITLLAQQIWPPAVVIFTTDPEQSMLVTTWLVIMVAFLQYALQMAWSRAAQLVAGRQSFASQPDTEVQAIVETVFKSAPLRLAQRQSSNRTLFRTADEYPDALYLFQASSRPMSVPLATRVVAQLTKFLRSVPAVVQSESDNWFPDWYSSSELSKFAKVVPQFRFLTQVSIALLVQGLWMKLAPRSTVTPLSEVAQSLPPVLFLAYRIIWLTFLLASESEAPMPAAPAPMIMTSQTVCRFLVRTAVAKTKRRSSQSALPIEIDYQQQISRNKYSGFEFVGKVIEGGWCDAGIVLRYRSKKPFSEVWLKYFDEIPRTVFSKLRYSKLEYTFNRTL